MQLFNIVIPRTAGFALVSPGVQKAVPVIVAERLLPCILLDEGLPANLLIKIPSITGELRKTQQYSVCGRPPQSLVTTVHCDDTPQQAIRAPIPGDDLSKEEFRPVIFVILTN